MSNSGWLRVPAAITSFCRLPIDQPAELGLGERRGDDMKIVDDKRDALAGPCVDAGGKRCGRRSIELDTDRLADDAGDLGKTSVG